MKVCLLFNPKAGSAGQIDRLRRLLAVKHQLTAVEARDAGDLARKAAAAAAGGYGAIAVAGGDGTIHAAVNGLGPRFPKTPLALLPLGTGNDFCRTLAVPLDPADAMKLLRRGRRRAIDLVRIEGAASPYLVNAATGGFSGRVAGEVTSGLKQFWGPLAYLRGAAGPIAAPVFYKLTIRYDGGPPEAVEALNVVVANGRTAAGGVPVAPLANPEDGRLDVVVVRAGDFFDASVVAASLMAGDYLEDEHVTHRLARRVEIESDPPMPFSIDGELIETRKLSFEVVPKALRVIVGPEYRPDPRGKAVGAAGWKGAFFRAVAGLFRLMAAALRWPGAGVTVAVLSVALFAWLTRGVLAGEWRDANAAVARTIDSRGNPIFADAARAVTRLGDPAIDIVLCAGIAGVLALLRRYAAAIGLIAVLVGVGATELVLKPWLAVPRPDLFGPPDPALGFGHPSGHALRAVGLAAFLAAALVVGRPFAAQRWAVGVGLWVLAFLVCLSRVYLGLHSLTDVLAGGLLGLAWAGVCAAAAFPYLIPAYSQPRNRT